MRRPSQSAAGPSRQAPRSEELWKSDGTTDGTVLVKDIFPGSSSSRPEHLTNVNGILYFRAHDGVNGSALWKTDGTADGTVIVKDTSPGTGNGFLPDQLTNVNGTLYFREWDDGMGLWKSDGTAAGTVLVKKIAPGVPSSWLPDRWASLNGALYLRANDIIHGEELWRSDGTQEGTTLVKDIRSGSGTTSSSSPKYLTNVDGVLYFSANDGVHGDELWRSDGTADGTFLVKDINPGSGFSEPDRLTKVGDTLYFRAHDGIHGWELWRSDGTADGTVLVKDIRQGSAFSEPEFLTDVNGTLYFIADDGVHGYELWKSDGTADGTVMVTDTRASEAYIHPQQLVNVSGTLYFSNNGIWKSAGTADGTMMVSAIRTVGLGSNPHLTHINGILYFRSGSPFPNDPDTGIEPWILRVSDDNTAPPNDMATVSEDTSNNVIDVLANDREPSGGTLTVAAVTQPAHGSARIETDGANVVYTPNPNFVGTDTFAYTASDGLGGTATAIVTVTVVNVDNDLQGTDGDDVFLVRRDASGANVEVFASSTATGTPVFSAPLGSVSSVLIEALAGSDRLIIDLGNGSPLPSGGLQYVGGANGAGEDQLIIRDSATANGTYIPDETTAGSGIVTLAGRNITLSGVEPIDISGLNTFTVVTPNANDALSVSRPAGGMTRLAGTSGALTFSPVTFADIGAFIIDAATNDGATGEDALTISASGVVPNPLAFLQYRSGTGANTLSVQSGTARIDATVDAGGTLNTSVGEGAHLITHRFRQSLLTVAGTGRATILTDGTDAATSFLNGLNINDGASLDIGDNALVIDYAGASLVATVREKILSGRGGAGFGASWNGEGITSSTAAQANATEPESSSVGYAENASLPLGPYTSFHGQVVDETAILIAFTPTGDANLDGVVNDDDVTIIGATYAPGVPQPHWALGDFDYSGFVDDDDVTLLGVFYNPAAAPLAIKVPVLMEATASAAPPFPGISGSAAVLRFGEILGTPVETKAPTPAAGAPPQTGSLPEATDRELLFSLLAEAILVDSTQGSVSLRQSLIATERTFEEEYSYWPE